MAIPLSRRHFALAGAAYLAASALGCVCGKMRPKSKRIGEVVTGRTATTLEGSSVSFPEPGKVTVVDFWATWCEPCHELMPELESLWKEYAGEGLVVVGVEAGDARRTVADHVHKLGLTYATVIDDRGGIRRDYSVDSLPHTVVMDRHGRIRSEVVGMSNSGVREIRGAVETALREA
jgi:thiol-disulfide isomerase/thioredoxin